VVHVRPGAQPAAPPAVAIATLRSTFRLVLSYDGTDYHGWQVQPRIRTVQGILLEAARRRFGPETRVIGASRTDAGVHALRQVASLTTTVRVSSLGLRGALNADLPRDIRVLAVHEAPAGFDARRAASGKRYAYLIDNGRVASPLLRRYAWPIPQRLDVDAMRRALAPLRGRHDFSAFCAAPGRDKDPVCVVRALHVIRRKERLALLISADRYLHHMARNIVGSAVAVARGGHDADWLGAVRDSRDRTRAGPTAPAQGLVLVRVLYSTSSTRGQ
jgi:tRNA pseudouridine38-40 synthase